MKTTVLALSIIVVCLGIDAWIPALPWYTVFIVAFLAGVIAGRTGAKSFATGFFGAGLFWALLLVIMHLRNGGLLTGRVSALIAEMTGAPVTPVVLLTAIPLLGALIGGLAALSGQLLTIPADPASRLRRRRKNWSGSYKLKI